MSIIDELEEIAGPTLRLTNITRRMKGKKQRTVDGVTERWCNRCDKWLPLDVFYRHHRVLNINKQTGSNYQSACKPCLLEYSRKRNAR